jgi:hypothetical protein
METEIKRQCGRPALPSEKKRHHVYVRLKLPPEDEWRVAIAQGGYSGPTELIQELVDEYLRRLEKRPEIFSENGNSLGVAAAPSVFDFSVDGVDCSIPGAQSYSPPDGANLAAGRSAT